jgi:hypothetical protein
MALNNVKYRNLLLINYLKKFDFIIIIPNCLLTKEILFKIEELNLFKISKNLKINSILINKNRILSGLHKFVFFENFENFQKIALELQKIENLSIILFIKNYILIDSDLNEVICNKDLNFVSNLSNFVSINFMNLYLTCNNHLLSLNKIYGILFI